MKLPLCAGIAALMSASCSQYTPPVNALPVLPPAALNQLCPQPVAMTDNSADAALITLKALYDQYSQCAGLQAERLKRQTP